MSDSERKTLKWKRRNTATYTTFSEYRSATIYRAVFGLKRGWIWRILDTAHVYAKGYVFDTDMKGESLKDAKMIVEQHYEMR